MLVYLTRHGETIANREGIILGRSDAPLTASGILVTARLGKVLKGCGISFILTSPLGRARKSAEIFGREIGVTPVAIDEMSELSCGLWEGMPRREVLGQRNMIRSTWTDRPPGGESCEDAEERVGSSIGIIRRELSKGPVLVVGHSVVNRVLIRLWYQLEPLFAVDLIHPHDLIRVLSLEEPVRWLRADGSSGEGHL